MITFFQLSFTTLFILFIAFIIIYGKQKRFNSIKDLVGKSIFDAIALNSGITVLLYVAGNIFNLKYFMNIDSFALDVALIVGGLIIIGDSLDKIINKQGDEK